LDEALARGGPTSADKTKVAKGMVAADIYGYAFGLVCVGAPLALSIWGLWRYFLG
jgi:hypothetical protein